LFSNEKNRVENFFLKKKYLVCFEMKTEAGRIKRPESEERR